MPFVLQSPSALGSDWDYDVIWEDPFPNWTGTRTWEQLVLDIQAATGYDGSVMDRVRNRYFVRARLRFVEITMLEPLLDGVVICEDGGLLGFHQNTEVQFGQPFNVGGVETGVRGCTIIEDTSSGSRTADNFNKNTRIVMSGGVLKMYDTTFKRLNTTRSDFDWETDGTVIMRDVILQMRGTQFNHFYGKTDINGLEVQTQSGSSIEFRTRNEDFIRFDNVFPYRLDGNEEQRVLVMFIPTGSVDFATIYTLNNYKGLNFARWSLGSGRSADFINPFFTNLQSTGANSGRSGHAFEKRTVDLSVLDNTGVQIEGARVQIQHRFDGFTIPEGWLMDNQFPYDVNQTTPDPFSEVNIATLSPNFSADKAPASGSVQNLEYSNPFIAQWNIDEVGSELPIRITYDLGQFNIQPITSYDLRAGNNGARMCKDWIIEGSTDNSSWSVLDTQTDIGWLADQEQNFIIANPGEYRYYRLTINQVVNEGNRFAISGWGLLANTEVPGAGRLNVLVRRRYWRHNSPRIGSTDFHEFHDLTPHILRIYKYGSLPVEQSLDVTPPFEGSGGFSVTYTMFPDDNITLTKSEALAIGGDVTIIEHNTPVTWEGLEWDITMTTTRTASEIYQWIRALQDEGLPLGDDFLPNFMPTPSETRIGVHDRQLKALRLVTPSDDPITGILRMQSKSGTFYVTPIQTSLTFNNLRPNSEVRIFRRSDRVELAGIENSGTTFTYNYEYTGDLEVFYVIFNLGYVPIKVNSFILTAQDQNIPVFQVVDRVFSP